VLKIFAVVSAEGVPIKGGEDSPNFPDAARSFKTVCGKFSIVESEENFEEVVARAKDEDVFVYGDSCLYRKALPHANWIYLTRLKVSVRDGETMFPRGGEMRGWRIASYESRPGFALEVLYPDPPPAP
jgi:dihydrofolate reductase